MDSTFVACLLCKVSLAMPIINVGIGVSEVWYGFYPDNYQEAQEFLSDHDGCKLWFSSWEERL